MVQFFFLLLLFPFKKLNESHEYRYNIIYEIIINYEKRYCFFSSLFLVVVFTHISSLLYLFYLLLNSVSDFFQRVHI